MLPRNVTESLMHKNMKLCKAAFSAGDGAKLNKSIQTNVMEMLFLLMAIPRRCNFTQMGRYGKRGEQCYRQTAERTVDWLGMNMWLGAFAFKEGKGRNAIVIDPSFIKKAGKHTPYVGTFWSGCAGAVRHGLEILGIGVIDVDLHECMMLKAVQTTLGKGGEKDEMTLYEASGKAYALKAWSKSLHGVVSLVIHELPDGGHRLYFSTDENMSGQDVMEYYTTRFQEEFCFRDAKQFLGLTDCQARDKRKLDFAFNSSFTALNVAKIMCKELGTSIGRLKAQMVNAYYAQRIIDVFERNPNTPLNQDCVNEIFSFAADAA